MIVSLLGLQSGFSDEVLGKFEVVCPLNGTAVLKGFELYFYQPTREEHNNNVRVGRFEEPAKQPTKLYNEAAENICRVAQSRKPQGKADAAPIKLQ